MPGHVTITGDVARRADTLAIRYELRGRLDVLVIPPPARTPARRNGLWEETCFECFLAVEDSPCYWEFNLSPSGCWNVYRFSGVRESMAEEEAFSSLVITAERNENTVSLRLETSLGGIIRAGEPLDVAVRAVVKEKAGALSYWALTHCGPRPDFHRRESFILRLPGDSGAGQ
jgi:hypothetical protein